MTTGTTDLVTILNAALSVPEAFFACAARCASRSFIEAPGSGRTLTYAQVEQQVHAVAAFLKERGVKEGDRVAILSQSRPEWLVADLAILSIGAITVSIYPSLPAHDVAFILWDSGAKVVFVENQDQYQKLEAVRARALKTPECERAPAGTPYSIASSLVVGFESCPANVPLLRDIAKQAARVDSAKLQRDSVASLVYTSGTTGAPKGVVQTHGNHLANIRQAFEGKLYEQGSRIFLMLPLAHSFARLMAYIGATAGVTLIFPSIASIEHSRQDPALVMREMPLAQATVIPVVPRILEKMVDGVKAKGRGESWGAKIFAMLLPSESRPGGVPLLTQMLGRVIKRALFGERLRYCISGGAKLNVSVNKFFDSLGIEILEGYGLTETCVATNCNREGHKIIGTVGPVLADDIQVKIAADGEICFKGPNITSRYWERPRSTAAAWDSDGWFHTGDIGELTSEKFLKITGRKKELIVTAGGKKIAPEPIEFKIKAHRYVAEAMLCGEGKPYCVALVTPNVTAIELELGSSDSAYQQAQAAIWSHIEELNADLASFESIKAVRLVRESCTVENGLLTPTLKLRRKEMLKRFGDLIEELFR